MIRDVRPSFSALDLGMIMLLSLVLSYMLGDDSATLSFP